MRILLVVLMLIGASWAAACDEDTATQVDEQQSAQVSPQPEDTRSQGGGARSAPQTAQAPALSEDENGEAGRARADSPMDTEPQQREASSLQASDEVRSASQTTQVPELDEDEDGEVGRSQADSPTDSESQQREASSLQMADPGFAVAQLETDQLVGAARPDGEPDDSLVLKASDGPFPILGRSADSAWIALRFRLNVNRWQPYVPVWVPAVQLRTNRALAELPVFVNGGAHAISLDEAGVPDGGLAVTDQLYHWHWLEDGSLVGSNAKGAWRWWPGTGELRLLADSPFGLVSPDGNYVANVHCPTSDQSIYRCANTVTISPVDGSISPLDGDGSIRFLNVSPFGGASWRLSDYIQWFPDSRHLLVVSDYIARWANWFQDRPEILGVDGSRYRFPENESARLLPDGSLLFWQNTDRGLLLQKRRLDQLNLDHTTGEWFEVEEPEGVPPIASSDGKRLVAFGRPVGIGGVHAWHLIDLVNGESRQIVQASLFSQEEELSDRATNRWKPLLFTENSVYLMFTGGGWVDVPTELLAGQELLRHDLDTGASQLVDVAFGRWGGQPYALCSDDCELMVIWVSRGYGYLISRSGENDALRAIYIELGGGERRGYDVWFDVYELSPDGTQLSTLRRDHRGYVEEHPGYDQEGFAMLQWHEFTDLIDEDSWWVHEFRIIDTADGHVIHRYRTLAEECGEGSQRAGWSPDGRWLVVAGDTTMCWSHP